MQKRDWHLARSYSAKETQETIFFKFTLTLPLSSEDKRFSSSSKYLFLYSCRIRARCVEFRCARILTTVAVSQPSPDKKKNISRMNFEQGKRRTNTKTEPIRNWHPSVTEIEILKIIP